MLEAFLSEDTFRRGLRGYLNTHAYGNARTDDLWAALTKQARAEGKDVDVKEVMDTWTRQMGYPVVSLSRDGAKVKATQERFLYNPRSTHKGEFTSE